MKEPCFVIGNIAKGDDFWDREAEIKDILRALEKGSVLLKSPRRFGKTSIMYKIYENTSHGFKTIFIDTEGIHDPRDFIARLMTELFSDVKIWNRFKDLVKVGVSSIEEIGVADFRLKIRENIGENWNEKGYEFISKLKDCSEKNLFILDELPFLVQNIWRKDGEKTACDFLYWFRSIRQMPALSHIRWLVGGSIGIEHILKNIGAGVKTINDFEILRIEPFSLDEGRRYIRALLKKEGQIKRANKSIINNLLKIIGAPVPYFIQILVKESLHEMRREKKRQLDSEIIQRAYKYGVLGPASKTYFEHYFTRLKDYYDENIEKAAKRLILEVARRERVNKTELFKLFRQLSEGRLSDDTFSSLMTDIENDFYVSYNFEDKSYTFTTNILRDWWLRYYDLMEE